MPTINQLVRKNRQNKTRKSKSPVLGIGYNSKDKKRTNQNSPQKRGVCTRVGTMAPKKPNSALRKYARVRLSNGIDITLFVVLWILMESKNVVKDVVNMVQKDQKTKSKKGEI